jgi:nicotinamidase-related amidase
MKYKRINKDDVVVLFVDHQAGLCSLVKDFIANEFKNSIYALADTAKLFKLPVVLTTSFETGPNGPMLPQLRNTFPDAPYIARPGQINAWDNEDFVAAIKKTGRKQLIIAGIVTEVCVAFPTLSALEAGFDVFVATDACGTFDEVARYAAWDRMAHAGAQLMNWFCISGELQRDWRNDVPGYAALLINHLPRYRHLQISYDAKK